MELHGVSTTQVAHARQRPRACVHPAAEPVERVAAGHARPLDVPQGLLLRCVRRAHCVHSHRLQRGANHTAPSCVSADVTTTALVASSDAWHLCFPHPVRSPVVLQCLEPLLKYVPSVCHSAPCLVTESSAAALRAAVPDARLESIVSHLNSDHKEVLFEEAIVRCDLTNEAHLVRCFDPVTMYLGEPPLMANRIFERWHGETWMDHSEL